jgi:hypothetical protein
MVNPRQTLPASGRQILPSLADALWMYICGATASLWRSLKWSKYTVAIQGLQKYELPNPENDTRLEAKESVYVPTGASQV